MSEWSIYASGRLLGVVKAMNKRRAFLAAVQAFDFANGYEIIVKPCVSADSLSPS
ncbi:MAG: hypothetical protein LBU43_02410 [Candidatus Accumulibacter sp.]|jgi:hypothetical protein|nr:hypothetical protein [Accumulibacter sp.]